MEIMQMGVDEPIDVRLTPLEYEVLFDAVWTTLEIADPAFTSLLTEMRDTMRKFKLLAD